MTSNYAIRSIVIVVIGADSDNDNEKKSLKLKKKESSIDIYSEMQKISRGNTMEDLCNIIHNNEASSTTISKPIPIPKNKTKYHYGEYYT